MSFDLETSESFGIGYSSLYLSQKTRMRDDLENEFAASKLKKL